MKRFCVITECIPLPKNTHGVFKRLGIFLKAFKDKGEIDFIFYTVPGRIYSEQDLRLWINEIWAINPNCIIQHPKENYGDDLSTFSSYFRSITSFTRQDNFKNICGIKQVACLDNYLQEHQPDLVYAENLAAMSTLLLSQTKVLPPILFDFDDIEHIAYIREILRPPKWLSKYLLFLQIPALMLGERKAMKLATKTFSCSSNDAKYISRIYQLSSICTVPNAIEIPHQTTIPGTDLAVLFIGTYHYKPNVEAAEYLISAVWPEILKLFPQARLYIAGNNPEAIPSYADKPNNVCFTGFVDDLEGLYSKVKIMCCPIFSAGGTRIKILEAAAFGKAIVSTKIGAEGIDLIDGKEILIGNGLQEIVDCCVKLLGNEELVTELGREARKRISENYDRQAIITLIQKHIEELL